MTVTDNGDGTAVAAAVGPLGDAVVSVSDYSDEVGTAYFSGTLAVSVVAGDVAAIEIVPGTPEPRA